MREILFRGKRIDNVDWVYGGITSSSHSVNSKVFIMSNIHFEGCEDEENFELMKVIPETIGQYTGLLDKDGNRIFEGDIVQLNQKYIKPIIVYWNSEMTGFYPLISERSNNLEIIGNIHDNYELISK